MKEPGITRHIQLNSDRLCSICRQPQFETSSGVTCVNGHGGADPITDNNLEADLDKAEQRWKSQ